MSKLNWKILGMYILIHNMIPRLNFFLLKLEGMYLFDGFGK